MTLKVSNLRNHLWSEKYVTNIGVAMDSILLMKVSQTTDDLLADNQLLVRVVSPLITSSTPRSQYFRSSPSKLKKKWTNSRGDQREHKDQLLHEELLVFCSAGISVQSGRRPWVRHSCVQKLQGTFVPQRAASRWLDVPGLGSWHHYP